jgi:hypothetical protein
MEDGSGQAGELGEADRTVEESSGFDEHVWRCEINVRISNADTAALKNSSQYR